MTKAILHFAFHNAILYIFVSVVMWHPLWPAYLSDATAFGRFVALILWGCGIIAVDCLLYAVRSIYGD